MADRLVRVNRAPVLTLWAVVVAERLGYRRKEALTLGKSLAGLNAQSKGQKLGVFKAPAEKEKPSRPRGRVGRFSVPLMGRELPVVREADEIRATQAGKALDPERVETYLHAKFREDLTAVEAAMHALAGSFSPKELSSRAFELYEQFRPEVPQGKRGWGAPGELDLSRIRFLERR